MVEPTVAKKAVIIGAGIGGLATAAQLVQKGFDVTVLEKNARIGGRLSGFSAEGYTFDAGPTILLMPGVLDEFFLRLGKRRQDYLDFVPVEPVSRIHFGPGDAPLELSADVAKMKSNLAAFSPSDSKNYERYLAKSKTYYDAALSAFLQANVHRVTDFLRPSVISAFAQIGLSGSYWDHVCRYFEDPRIRAAFSFQSIYVGASPRDIPAAYGLIQYVEATQGAWSVPGGLHRIASVMADVAQKGGVNIQTGKKVKQIRLEKNKVIGVDLFDGSFVPADLVVSNADLPYSYAHLLPQKSSPVQQRKLEPSCSAFMMYLGVKRKLPIGPHTFLLPSDFISSLEALFHDKRLPLNPGIYLNCPSKLFPEMAPKNGDALYVLVPVPNLQAASIDWKTQKKGQTQVSLFRQLVLDKINDWLHLDLKESDIAFERIVTPADWQDQYSLEWGSTFGLSPTLQQSAFFRPQNRDPRVKNLYFVGGSTHPGSGIPIVLFSANNVVQRIVDENPSGIPG
ncbi:phytoene desaturase [Candidatus Micrarchaeota archaeon]|nr:phytoene desaturase [Candidatus Micrarchaeota archaeon]